MKSHTLLILFLLTLQALSAQTLRAYERAGDSAFERKDWGTAFQHYRTALERDDDNTAVLWKFAESARLFHALPEAERAYAKLSSDSGKRKKKYPLLDFQLGEVKKMKGDYTAAISCFEQFLAEKPEAAAEYFEKAQTEIETCQAAAALVNNASKELVITHPGKEINSPYSDFAPMMAGDTLLFSSYRFDKKTPLGKPKTKLTKVLMSVKGGRAREMGRGFPSTDTAHIAHTALTPDGRYLFFTICKNLNATDIRCELWLTALDRRGRWLPALRLPEPINLKNYTSTQPAVGYDSAAMAPVLWFASDRPGGKGKLDLWSLPLDTNFFCPCNLPLPGKKITQLPKFAPPSNVAALNTPENDGTPFFHTQGQQLYFSSEGWPGLGGYDIFSSKKMGAAFVAPKNAGAGLNTSYNDLYFALRPDGRTGYLSSNRHGSFYLDEANKACCNDLFAFRLPPPQPPPTPKPLAGDSLPQLVAKTPPPTAEIPVVPPVAAPPKLQEFVGLPLYFDNDEPDKRTRRTTTQKSYEETVLAYLERQPLYRERFAAGLHDDKADDAESRVDDFFENDVRRGYDRLSQLCDLLLSRLQNDEPLEVVIKGFTSPRAQSDYNLNLGKRRISSVRNQFEAYADGALQTYLRSGQLKITEASFGETTARVGISDNLSDERNSVYHPDAARERRVEIVAIRER